MQEEVLKENILNAVQKVYPRVSFTADLIELEKPKNSEFGDVASNVAFKLAGQLGRSPIEIAERLEEEIPVAKAIGGFLNFKLTTEDNQQNLFEILNEGKSFGSLALGKEQKIQVEFISANPTGPLHLGNGRGGFYGDVLGNALKKAGYKVEKEYYVNDGGGQVIKLGKSVLACAGYLPKEEQEYGGEYITEIVENNRSFIEENKEDIFAVGYKASLEIMENHIKPSTKRMKINFDNFFSEKELRDKKEDDRVIQVLSKKGLTYEKDDALWLKTTEYGDDKDRVLVKSDGEKTYVVPDIAYHFNKLAERKFDRVINIWGTDHHGYVSRLKAAVGALGFESRLDIILMQLVRLIKDGKEFKMSKRAGVSVTFDELMDLIGTADASDVARFLYLSKSYDTHMDFDLDLARDTSEKNPVYYVKYAYARINGILRNSNIPVEEVQKSDLSLIKEPAETDLIKKLYELPGIIEEVATDGKYPVHRFTYYIQDVATKFHKFYHDHQVISEDTALTKARLALVLATKNVLEITGEDILGLDLPEKM